MEPRKEDRIEYITSSFESRGLQPSTIDRAAPRTLLCRLLEPTAGAFFECGASALKMNVFGRSGSDVGEGVEDGVVIGAEFILVGGEAGGEVSEEGVKAVFASGFFPGLWIGKVQSGLQGDNGVSGGHTDAADAGEEGFDGGDFFLEDDAVGAVLAHETDVGAVEDVGDFGEVWIHNTANWHRGWDNCGLRYFNLFVLA